MFLPFLGVSLNPIIVYCSNQEDMDNWFGLLKEHIEANGGTAIKPDTYSRVRVWSYQYSVLILCLEKKDNDLHSTGYAVKLGLSNLDQCYCSHEDCAGVWLGLRLRLRLTTVTVS